MNNNCNIHSTLNLICIPLNECLAYLKYNYCVFFLYEKYPKSIRLKCNTDYSIYS